MTSNGIHLIGNRINLIGKGVTSTGMERERALSTLARCAKERVTYQINTVSCQVNTVSYQLNTVSYRLNTVSYQVNRVEGHLDKHGEGEGALDLGEVCDPTPETRNPTHPMP